MEASLPEVLDVMRVPASGDSSVAVRAVGDIDAAQQRRCDILIAGGGTGGVAAALAAARAGRSVVLLEETDWLGGQLTAQGVSALDEHEHIESFGGTASYYRLRNALRQRYRNRAGDRGRRDDFNPGACWVTRLAFEPRVAVDMIEQLLQPLIESGRQAPRATGSTASSR
jgi:glycine/D-amino acid oxidase-like deaminating enzyme